MRILTNSEQTTSQDIVQGILQNAFYNNHQHHMLASTPTDRLLGALSLCHYFLAGEVVVAVVTTGLLVLRLVLCLQCRPVDFRVLSLDIFNDLLSKLWSDRRV
jgi:hypothetical protein